MLKTLQIRKGAKLTIRAVAYSSDEPGKRDKCPVLAFFEEQSKRDPEEFSELTALLEFSAENGPPSNDTKFKHLTGTSGLHEFKTGGGLRLFCFYDEGSLIVCTDGLLKKKQRAPKDAIKRAGKMKREYEVAKKSGELKHVEPKSR
jgi:hypothetical protein